MKCFILKCNFEVFNVVLKNPNFSMSIFKTLHRICQWLLGNLNEIPMEYLEEMEERSLKRGRHWKR